MAKGNSNKNKSSQGFQNQKPQPRTPTGNIGFLYRHPNEKKQFSKKDTVVLNEPNLAPITRSKSFNLKLSYPGLYVGMGYSINNTLENGMSFDYTTGLPYIPGSEVKGMLRSCFIQHPKGTLEKLKKITGLECLDERNLHTLECIIFGNPIKRGEEYDNLPSDTFQGNVVFYDAFPLEGEIRSDYITPHKEESKNPIAIQTLKVASGSKFQFQFSIPEALKFEPYEIKKEKVAQLFKDLILDYGIGAKTRVGYGTFQEGQ